MAKKRGSTKRSKKRTAAKRSKKRTTRSRSATPRSRAARKKASRKKKAPARSPARRARAAGTRRPRPTAARSRARPRAIEIEDLRGLGPESAGQSGDTEGLSRNEVADSESVEELVEEGQAFEAGIIAGVEDVPDADRGGVRTREVPEDDVPQEYLDED